MNTASSDPSTADAPLAGRREWVGLAVLALPTLMVSFDLFALLLALPRISSQLSASSSQQLWITDIYGFMVGGFLITMGNLGDRIGRRRLLMFGAAVFGIASICAAYSPNVETLIVARAALGIAGATLAPSTLSLITTMFRDPRQMGAAIGVWAGCFTAGAILGPVVGGLLLAHFWWGSVFLIGVPAVALLLVVGPRVLPESRNPHAGRLDVSSAALSLAAILSVVYGIKQLALLGWALVPSAFTVLGVILGMIFIRRQRTLADPFLDLKLFSSRPFRFTMLGLLAYSSLTGATLLFVTQFLQSVAGLSPLRAGLAMIPGLACGVLSITVSPMLARKIRPAHLIAGGMMVTVLGLLVITQLSASAGWPGLIAGFSIWCLGGGPLIAIGTGLVVSSAPPEKMGAASALPQVGNELGSALGMAVLGALGTLVYRVSVSGKLPTGLSEQAASASHENIARASAQVASLHDPVLARTLQVAARHAFVDGLHLVAGISAVLLTVMAVVLARVLRDIPPTGGQAPAASPEADQSDSNPISASAAPAAAQV